MRKLCVIAIASVLSAPATAQELNGFYVGGAIGGGVTEGELKGQIIQTDFDVNEFEFDDSFSRNVTQRFSESFFLGNADGSGAAVDGFLGYNHGFGRWLVGLQGEGALTNYHFESAFPVQSSSTAVRDELAVQNGVSSTERTIETDSDVFNDFIRVDSNWALTAYGRLGFFVGPKMLMYAGGGVTYAQFRIEDRFTVEEAVEEAGFVVGAGLEQIVSSNISLRLDYRYTKFDNVQVKGKDVSSDFDSDDNSTFSSQSSFVSSVDMDLRTHAVKGAVVLNF